MTEEERDRFRHLANYARSVQRAVERPEARADREARENVERLCQPTPMGKITAKDWFNLTWKVPVGLVVCSVCAAGFGLLVLAVEIVGLYALLCAPFFIIPLIYYWMKG